MHLWNSCIYINADARFQFNCDVVIPDGDLLDPALHQRFVKIEFFSLLGVGAGDAIIRVYSGKFPIRIFLNILCIVFYLSFVAGSLLIAAGTDTTVRCDFELRFFFFLLTSVVSNLSHCRNQHYISHY